MLAKKEELEKYLVAALRHSMEVHYYLVALNLHSLNRIHDLEGLNNKFEIDVALRLALGFKNGNAEAEFKQEIEIGKELHRKQKHHQILKTPNLDTNEYSESLVDAICAAREERSYHKKRTWDEILKHIESELSEKRLNNLVIDLIKRMRKIAEPDVSSITNLRNFPNIGLEENLYRRFRARCVEALEVFHKKLDLLLF